MMVCQQVDAVANHEHLAKLEEGVEAWNGWRRADHDGKTIASLQRAELVGAKLHGVRFDEAFLDLAHLREADLSAANISSANLRLAHLSSADLTGADLSGSDLHGAVLYRARLVGANLYRTNLTHADLEYADMTEAILMYTTFGDNDLSNVFGLNPVKHEGPSTIGIDTIYRSKGNIPESFLRGCGVPEEFITYAKSLVANPIQFYSCFISYSTNDQAFADRLYADLQNKGVRCWFAAHDVQGGRKLHEQIDEAIRLHDKLLLIPSPHSMESEWVKTEIAKARKREVRDPESVLKRRVLFPIRLAPFETLRDWECFDADTGKDSAREIREYFIPDFSNWKNHDSYQEAFQRLISDLKATDSKPK
jgi:uncharacterized protein YjbI with pentapeptide repeats